MIKITHHLRGNLPLLYKYIYDVQTNQQFPCKIVSIVSVSKKESLRKNGGFRKVSGDDLLSHPVTRAVPSALRGLTTEFGMGSGDPPRYGRREKNYG